MITKLYVDNYKSVGPGLELELGRLTALVGPNGSGKSNVADALRFLSDCVNTSLSHAVAVRHGFPAIRRSGEDQPLDVSIGVEIEDERGSGTWTLALGPTDRPDGFVVKHERAAWRSRDGAADFGFERQGAHAEVSPNTFGFERMAISSTSLALPLLAANPEISLNLISRELRRLAIYSLFPNTLRAPQAPNPADFMTASGDNWASALKEMDRERWGAEFLVALERVVGDIDDYRVAQVGGFLIPEFRHGNGAEGHERWLGAAQESDGTLRVAAVLTALFQWPPLQLIGFEEPELAVHPGAIPILFDFLKEASTRGQVLLTTHSPDLLDLLSIEDLRVVERRGGLTAVSRVEERQRELVTKRLVSTSDLLHAEGLHAERTGTDG